MITADMIEIGITVMQECKRDGRNPDETVRFIYSAMRQAHKIDSHEEKFEALYKETFANMEGILEQMELCSLRAKRHYEMVAMS